MIQTGRFLEFLATLKPGSSLLELGTGFGFSAAWLLSGMDQTSRLTTIEISSDRQKTARRHFRSDKRVEFILEDAGMFLSENKRKFDLVFADAVPGKFENPQLALNAVKRGGFCVMDDMIPLPDWPSWHRKRIMRLAAQLHKLPDFSSLTFGWGTGITLLIRNSAHS